MSPQKEGESLDMYLYRLELTQERQEDDITMMSSRVDKVESIALEARQVATETNTMVQAMPQKIIEAIDERERLKRKEQKLDGKERLLLAMAIIGTIGGLAGTAATIKQAFGG